jgi:hypothetical protein
MHNFCASRTIFVRDLGMHCYTLDCELLLTKETTTMASVRRRSIVELEKWLDLEIGGVRDDLSVAEAKIAEIEFERQAKRIKLETLLSVKAKMAPIEVSEPAEITTEGGTWTPAEASTQEAVSTEEQSGETSVALPDDAAGSSLGRASAFAG